MTWSDSKSSGSESSNSYDNRYEQNENYLVFISSINSNLNPLNALKLMKILIMNLIL